MKTIKDMKGVKPLPKKHQQKVSGGSAEAVEASESDVSKPRPPLILIVLHY